MIENKDLFSAWDLQITWHKIKEIKHTKKWTEAVSKIGHLTHSSRIRLQIRIQPHIGYTGRSKVSAVGTSPPSQNPADTGVTWTNMQRVLLSQRFTRFCYGHT